MKRTIYKTLFLWPLVLGGAVALADDPEVKSEVQEETPTPLSAEDQMQGSKKDVELTQRLRKDLMRQDDLSTAAKNVTIVTVNGVLTVKGPVKSENERKRVAALAKKVAGAKHVRSQLEVSP